MRKFFLFLFISLFYFSFFSKSPVFAQYECATGNGTNVVCCPNGEVCKDWCDNGTLNCSGYPTDGGNNCGESGGTSTGHSNSCLIPPPPTPTPTPTQCRIDGGYCTQDAQGCSSGQGTMNPGYGCTAPDQCCLPIPTCNTGIKCSTCGNPNYNTCNTNNATGTNCYYSTYNNGPQFCNFSFTAPDQPNTCSIYNCDANAGYTYCQNGTCQRDCNTGYSFCTACGGGSQPPNTCNNQGTNPGSRTCTHTTYNGNAVTCNDVVFTDNTCHYSYDTCSANYSCPGVGKCVTHATVKVFEDYNHNGVLNAGEPGFQGATVTVSGGETVTSDANGIATFTGLPTGTYTFTITKPANYITTTPISFNFTLTNANGDAQAGSFGVSRLYSISGNIYNDINADGYYFPTANGGPETLYTTSSTIKITDTNNNTITSITTSNGTYTTGLILPADTYNVIYNTGSTPLPTSYKFTYLSSFQVGVGKPGTSIPCFTNNYHSTITGKDVNGNAITQNVNCDAIGNIGNVYGVNFGINNQNTTIGGICSDIRIDSGISSILSQSTSGTQVCGPNDPPPGTIIGTGDGGGVGSTCSNNAPGIAFTGSTTADFGLGQAALNPYNLVAGGSLYAENFTPVNNTVYRSSYSYISTTANQSGTTPIDLQTVCPILTDCTLPSNLAHGLYKANGNVTLHAYNFPNGNDYVFLINGNLTIDGNILIPSCSTGTFAASGNILVDSSVGQSLSLTGAALDYANLEGFYSAEGNFVVQTAGTAGNMCNLDGTPKDKKLNVVGSVNALSGVVNQRDLCTYDLACSTVVINGGGTQAGGGSSGPTPTPGGPTPTPGGGSGTINDSCPGGSPTGFGNGAAYILNAPRFIKHTNTVFQEL